jgi:hypothetical protein
VSYDSGTNTITFKPLKPLINGQQFTLKISGIKDLAGNAMAETAIKFNTFQNLPTIDAFSGPPGMAGGISGYNKYSYDTNGN